MNTYLTAAATLAFLVGLVHSVLGERLVFSRMRQGQFVPTNGGTLLQQRHVRILWASWHVVTVLGWALAGTLLLLASEPTVSALSASLSQVIIVATLAGSALVLYGTRARHPGWVGLLGVAVLTWLGISP